MRRLASLLLLALLLGGGAHAQTITYATPGVFNFVVPPGVHAIKFAVYGYGGGTEGFGGGGGGFCLSQLAVTPGATVYLNVGPTLGAENGASWLSIASNALPGSTAAGCVADGSLATGSPGVGGAGRQGNILNFTGGSAANVSGSGGGGGAGPGGNGANSTGAFGAAGGAAAFGLPAGGHGGDGGAGASGVAPGGGGGAGFANASAGRVIVQYIFVPPASGTSQMFLTWPG